MMGDKKKFFDLALLRPISGGSKQLHPLPVVQHHRYSIPESRYAAAFYLDNVFVPYGMRERLLALGRRVFPKATLKLLSSTESGGDQSEDSSIKNQHGGRWTVEARLEITEQLIALVKDIVKKSGNIVPVYLDDSVFQYRPRPTVFFVAEGTSELLAVAKISYEEHERIALRRIHDSLERLRNTVSPELAETFPKPLVLVEERTFTIYLESGLPGRSFYAERKNDWWPSRLILPHFAMAAQWLSRFQAEAVTGQLELSEEIVEEFIRAPMDRDLATITPTKAELGVQEWVLDHAAAVKGARIPLVWAHGDYWARNLIRNEAGISVVDWEAVTDRALPFSDWFMFILSYGFLVESPSDTKYLHSGIGGLFPGAAPEMVEAINKLLRECRRTLDIDDRLFDIFLPVFLMERAANEIDTGRHVNSNGPWRGLLHRYATHPKRHFFSDTKDGV